jgi:hypothetical protein
MDGPGMETLMLADAGATGETIVVAGPQDHLQSAASLQLGHRILPTGGPGMMCWAEVSPGSRWLAGAGDYMILGVCRPLTEVGRIRIQNGCCTAVTQGCRPRRVSRCTSASASTISARPVTSTLHPDRVCSL